MRVFLSWLVLVFLMGLKAPAAFAAACELVPDSTSTIIYMPQTVMTHDGLPHAAISPFLRSGKDRSQPSFLCPAPDQLIVMKMCLPP